MRGDYIRPDLGDIDYIGDFIATIAEKSISIISANFRALKWRKNIFNLVWNICISFLETARIRIYSKGQGANAKESWPNGRNTGTLSSIWDIAFYERRGLRHE